MPVLFLSARDTELDKVVGLEIGGDDYLAKPFGIRELQARVKALLRARHAGTREGGTASRRDGRSAASSSTTPRTPRSPTDARSTSRPASSSCSRV